VKEETRNEWKDGLGYEELRILYYIFIVISFGIDFIESKISNLWNRKTDKVPWKSGDFPRH
jgi:hypothetical protein